MKSAAADNIHEKLFNRFFVRPGHKNKYIQRTNKLKQN